MPYVSSTTHSHGPWNPTTLQTFSYTLVNGSGNDRGLFVFIHWEDARDDTIPTSVTYGGQAMTKVADVKHTSQSFKCGTQVWWINDADLPSTNGSNTVSVQYASAGHATSSQAEYIVIEYSDVDQTAPSNFQSAVYTDPATDSLSLTVTPAGSDSIIIGAMTTGYVSNVTGQTGTLRHEVDGTSSTGAVAEYTNTGTAAVDMDIGLNGTGNRASYVAFELEIAPVTQPTIDGVGQLGSASLIRKVRAVESVGEQPIASLIRGALALEAIAQTSAPSRISGVPSASGVAQSPVPSLVRGAASASSVAELPATSLLRGASSVSSAGSLTIPSMIRSVSSLSAVGVLPATSGPVGGGVALHRINCGGAEYTDGSSNVWVADNGTVAGTNIFTTADPISGTDEDTLYQSSRNQVTAGGTFGVTYTLAVPAGIDVLVRVHLCEQFYTATNKRRFGIYIDGGQVASEIDIWDEVGHDAALIKEYTHTTTGENIVVKVQNGSIEKATICALEIITVGESDLVPTVTGAGVLPKASLLRGVSSVPGVGVLPSASDVSGSTSVTAAGVLPKASLVRGAASVTAAGVLPLTDQVGGGVALHRINCGGAEYTDGSSNVWVDDSGAVSGTAISTTADPISGTEEDTLYQTSRRTSAAGGTFGVTYTLAVPAGVPVLVRAHFCEQFYTATNQRRFGVFLDGGQVDSEIDIWDEVGHDTALIKEYEHTTTGETLTVKIQNGSIEKATICALEVITVGTSTPSVDGVGVLPKASLIRGASSVVGVGVTPPPDVAGMAPSVTAAGVLPVPSLVRGVSPVVGVGVTPAPEPDPTGSLSAEVTGSTQFTAAVGGSPTPSGFTLTITNDSASAMRFEAKACCDWLMLTDYYGTLDPGESLMIGVIADTDELSEGAYSALVCVCSRESHDHNFVATPVRAEIGSPAAALATRYIDYETGDDTNDGLSDSTPWQHLPMDTNATGNAASHAETPGDEYILKGGVHYRGRLVLGADGTVGSRIVIDGNTRGTWGTGPAIIDGSELIGGWTDNLDGTFTASISDAKWFDKTARGLRPFDGDRLMTAAQWPVKQPEKFRYDDMTTWQIADSTTATSATWSGFAALPGDAFDGKVYIQCWRDDNRVHTAEVTGFDSGTNTVTFTPSLTWTTSQDHRFVLTNSPAFLTDPGEFVVDDVAETVTVIPYDATPDNISGSTVAELVDMLGDYWHIRGAILQRAGGSSDFQGSAIANFTGTSQHTRIEGCQIRWCPSQRGTIDFRGTHTGTEIEGCALYQNILGRDIQIVGGDGGTGQQDALIRHNVLFASGGTGIFSNTCNGVWVDKNLIVRNLSVHGNGISLYEGTYDGKITRNIVVEGNIAISLQINSDDYGGENCLVAHNLCDLKSSFLGYGSTLAIYSLSQSAGIQILNNTLINPYGQAFSIGTHAEFSQPLLGLEIRNNIMEGANGGVNPSAGLGITTSNNHFLAEWDSSYPYDATDLMETDKSVIFNDHLNRDFTLAPTSPCIDTGYETGLTLVPAVGPRDRGAYEYAESNLVPSVDGVGVLPKVSLVRGAASVTAAGVLPEAMLGSQYAPSVPGVGVLPKVSLIRGVVAVPGVGVLPLTDLTQGAPGLSAVGVLPKASLVRGAAPVVGVGVLPDTLLGGEVPSVAGVGVLPLVSLIRGARSVTAVGVLPSDQPLSILSYGLGLRVPGSVDPFEVPGDGSA